MSGRSFLERRESGEGGCLHSSGALLQICNGRMTKKCPSQTAAGKQAAALNPNTGSLPGPQKPSVSVAHSHMHGPSLDMLLTLRGLKNPRLRLGRHTSLPKSACARTAAVQALILDSLCRVLSRSLAHPETACNEKNSSCRRGCRRMRCISSCCIFPAHWSKVYDVTD